MIAKKGAKKIAIPPNEAARMLGSRGGKKRAENLSKQELKDAAKKAAEARWGKREDA